ncbi:MAG: hypothetical protein ACUVRV_11645 [Cyanobacteriota bacterium]
MQYWIQGTFRRVLRQARRAVEEEQKALDLHQQNLRCETNPVSQAVRQVIRKQTLALSTVVGADLRVKLRRARLLLITH